MGLYNWMFGPTKAQRAAAARIEAERNERIDREQARRSAASRQAKDRYMAGLAQKQRDATSYPPPGSTPSAGSWEGIPAYPASIHDYSPPAPAYAGGGGTFDGGGSSGDWGSSSSSDSGGSSSSDSGSSSSSD